MDPSLYYYLPPLALAFSIFYLFFRSSKNSLPFPPGPRCLPILGYLPFLGTDVLGKFTDLARHYGPIYKLWLGQKFCVVISSPALAKEIVRDQDVTFANRDNTAASLALSHGGNGVVFSPYGNQWRVLRKILVRDMQSTKGLESSTGLRKDECRKAVRYVYSNTGKPVNIGELAFVTELNLIMNILWGGTIVGEKGEKFGADFRNVIERASMLLGKPNVCDFFPSIAWLDVQGVKRDMESIVRYFTSILDEVFAEHEKLSKTAKSEGRKDFLQILSELQGEEKSELVDIGMAQIKALMSDIILGGTDTSTTTIELAMSEIMRNPKILEKAQAEVSEVVGLNNIVEESHALKLPYLQAIIKETLRLHPPAPLLVPRRPSQSATVGGYAIPEKTRVFINAWAIHRDPSNWDSPLEFRPERFLNASAGKWDYRGNSFDYIPFGSGRRICPGVPLAERMMAYFLASMLHSFNWEVPKGETVDMEVDVGVVLKKRVPLLVIPTPRLSDTNLYA